MKTAIEKAQLEHDAETKMLDAAKESMGPEQYALYLKERNASKVKRESEEAEERRHKELCQAIRAISFWRFGR